MRGCAWSGVLEMSAETNNKMKETKMKSFIKSPRSLFVASLALAAIGLLSPNLTLAEGKGASKLMFPASSPAPAVSVKAPAKTCPMCVDAYRQAADTEAKGMRAGSLKAVAFHMCPSCSTTITAVGSGKAKTDKVTHSCGTTQSSCCLATK